MVLKHPIQSVFTQLSDSLAQLSDVEYSSQSVILSNATIGQHVRHIIELFQCLENGYEPGIVNYEKRKRDYRIENDRSLARKLLKGILTSLARPNKDIFLEASDCSDTGEAEAIPSNYYREIAYNLEHTIHHMALIRVGIHEVSSIILPEQYGVAYSTLKFRGQCAQ